MSCVMYEGGILLENYQINKLQITKLQVTKLAFLNWHMNLRR
jgi:hypothetical protein